MMHHDYKTRTGRRTVRHLRRHKPVRVRNRVTCHAFRELQMRLRDKLNRTQGYLRKHKGSWWWRISDCMDFNSVTQY